MEGTSNVRIKFSFSPTFIGFYSLTIFLNHFLGSRLPTRSTGGFDHLSSKLGGSTLSGGTLKFEAALIYIFRGAPTLFSTTSSTSCEGLAANDDPCKLHVTHSDAKSCFDCPPGPSNTYKMSMQNGIYHIACATGLTNAENKKQNSVLYPNRYDFCEVGRTVIIGSVDECQDCTAAATGCTHCSGSDPNDCLGCAWKNEKTPNSGSCTGSCSSGRYFAFGKCPLCSDGCSSCPFNQCALNTFDVNSVYVSQYYCSFATQYSTGSGCGSCSPQCSSCFGSGNNECLGCPAGKALNIETHTCVGSCDSQNGKYVDSSGNCASCPTGCKSCLDGSYCTSCDSANNYYLDGSSCAVCQTSTAKFLNTANNPPTCDHCPVGCSACTDFSTCTACSAASLQSDRKWV